MTVQDTTAAAAKHEMQVRVWDLFVRLFHWTVTVAFFITYFTEDDLLTLHVWAGYVIGALVVLRVLWGFFGPKHARFSDFIYPPAAVWRYALDLVRFRGRRYLGHSPAGGAMVLALLAGLAATVWTGLELYAVEENAGPLAYVSAPGASGARADNPPLLRVSSDEDDAKEARGEREDAEEFWEELHEVLANVMMALVILHIGGVALASVVHRENLPRAMVTGLKRVD